jgi:hypothetical protein
MKQRLISAVCGVLLMAAGVNAQAITNFKSDVNNAIDAGLNYAISANWFTDGNNATGLLLLALLEKRPDLGGYAGLTAAEKLKADAAANILITSGAFAARAGQYSYTDGQVLMALSVYSNTGGPDNPNGSVNNVRWAIDRVVDRLVTNQTSSGACSGYWGYSGGGCDSSTTQFAAAGLSAAKNFYTNKGDPGGRLAGITTALDRTAAGYTANAKNGPVNAQFSDCGAQGCKGHGYQVSYATPTYQQTASGTWGQLLGTGNNLNSNGIQSYLRWLMNAYNYENNPSYNDGFPQFYMYYMWSSAKAYALLETSGLAPGAGNIDTSDLGSMAANGTRLARRNPATDVRPAVRGADGAGPCAAPNDGFYCETPPNWYYDYAYTLMNRQLANGSFPNPNGSWGAAGATQADHAYAILVLVRSVGGACVDTDQDGVCDSDDNCVNTSNANQADADGDGVGDVCDNCKNTANPGQEDQNQNGIGDACEGKCDVDKDGDIDKVDTSMISKARGKKVPPLDQAYDANGDGMVSPADVKACIPLCTLPNCAIPVNPVP